MSPAYRFPRLAALLASLWATSAVALQPRLSCSWSEPYETARGKLMFEATVRLRETGMRLAAEQGGSGAR